VEAVVLAEQETEHRNQGGAVGEKSVNTVEEEEDAAGRVVSLEGSKEVPAVSRSSYP